MTKVLTAEQIAAYERDGFVAPIDIFTEDEAADSAVVACACSNAASAIATCA